MFLSDFDYDLPAELIARYPTSERCGSRLLVVGAELDDRRFGDVPELLAPGDLLILNDTRVIRARLFGRKSTGGRVEILVERILADGEVLAQVRASKSPKPETKIILAAGVIATVLDRDDDLFLLKFSVDVHKHLEQHGEVPLPPYLERREEKEDDARYQTVYAARPGAVAAPTAGLHFDETMLDELDSKGVRSACVTLHVGAGTFRPLRYETVDENKLHSERLIVGEETVDAINVTRATGGRVIAVGTTSVRALEAASSGGDLQPVDSETDLFIRPGYRFCSVDGMITNFHLPKSSLLMLVSAFAGRERLLTAYRHAVAEAYRFFSYGDAMLVWPETQ